MEVLTAYVRQHSPWPPHGVTMEAVKEEKLRSLGTDIQTAMTVIGRRTVEHDQRNLDLTRTDLRGLALLGVHLRYAHLEFSNLESANLYGTNLDHARLFGANLKNSWLQGVHPAI